MSSHRFPPVFKDEAVRQIIERDYSVAEVSERLGVSTNSLYKWVKTEQHATQLVDATSEVLKLREQLRRREEERDIPKKAVRYFAAQPE